MHKNLNMIKILFLAANPIDSCRLRLDEEVRTIKDRIQASDRRDSFDIVQEWAVRVSDLQRHLLHHKPHILHFSGHAGPSGQIVLEDSSGRSRPVSPDTMKGLFAILKDNLRCVVLNACSSEGQARAIAESVDCAVGMSSAIDDRSAIAFAAGFYQALGHNSSIADAFELGCNQIRLEGLDGGDTPKLITKAGVNPGKIYLTDEPLESLDSPRRLEALSLLYITITECHSVVVAYLSNHLATREEFGAKVSTPVLAFVRADKNATIYMNKDEEQILAEFRGQIGLAQDAIRQRLEAQLGGQRDFSLWPMFDWRALDTAYDNVISWLRSVLNPMNTR